MSAPTPSLATRYDRDGQTLTPNEAADYATAITEIARVASAMGQHPAGGPHGRDAA